jgi:LPXTG-motif cell wall-anchored protein
MDKKKIIIIAGIGLLVVGVGFYLWKKSKKNTEAGGETGGETGGTGATADAKLKSAEPTPEASVEAVKNSLTSRKDKRKACGRKPLLKKKLAEWNKCVQAGGKASFEGDYDEFEGDYDEFEGDYDEFEGLDLDLN